MRAASPAAFAQDNQEFEVEAGRFLGNADDLKQVVVGVYQGKPVYLRDVATQIVDGPAEPDDYVLYANGAGSPKSRRARRLSGGDDHAGQAQRNKRHRSSAKRRKRKSTRCAAICCLSDLNVTVTRNYGETAKDKSDELLKHLLLATLSVTLLIALALGWRESGVVLIAIPVTLALTLFIFYFFGYTLNRVTLFALIFSIGILVDDAIVVVENMVRHFRLPSRKPTRKTLECTLTIAG